MTEAQHYLAVGVDRDNLVWQWLCAGRPGDPCRPGDGDCELIDCWYGMSDHGAYRRTPDLFDLISFTGTLASGTFTEDPNGTDTLAFRMQWEYMEILLNGVPVPDVRCNIRQVGIFAVNVYRDEYEERTGQEEPGALWETDGQPFRFAPGTPYWSQFSLLHWDYTNHPEGAHVREQFFQTLRDAH